MSTMLRAAVAAIVSLGMSGVLSAFGNDIQFSSWPKFQVYPYAACPESQAVPSLELRGAADTYLTNSLLVESASERKNLTVQFTAWTPELAGVVPDLYVVHVWSQLVRGSALNTKIPPPAENLGKIAELLVKDERLGKEYWDEQNQYHPPPMPEALRFDLAAREKKQLWLQCRMPPGTPAGTYGTTLQILDGGTVAASLPLTVRVEPYNLPASTKLFGIYWKGRVFIKEGFDYYLLPEQRALEELRDIKAHGFESIYALATSTEEARRLLGVIEEAGLKGPIVLNGVPDRPAVQAMYKERGYAVYFYGYDEPGLQQLPTALDMITQAHREKVKMCGAIQKMYSDRLDAIEPLDWANFAHFYNPATVLMKDFTDFEPLKRGQYTVKHELDTYYFQPWDYDKDPVWNRLVSGFYLFRSGFDGIFPYVYMAFHKGLPYSEDWRYYPPGTQDSSFRMFCTAYPGDPKPVSTLQWEALREGAQDCRYSELAYSLIESARTNAKYQEWRKRLQTLLNPFSVAPGVPVPATTAYDVARIGLMDLIGEVMRETTPKALSLSDLVRGTVMTFGVNPEEKSRAPVSLVVPNWSEQVPDIDGVLKDGIVWRQAALIPKLVAIDGTAAKNHTTVRVVRTGEYLCVAFECEDPQARKAAANAQVRIRDGKVWNDDCVEIYIQPSGGKYYQFVVNIAGYGTDIEGQGAGTVWNSDFEYAVTVQDNGWIAEIKIPMSQVRLKPGDRVRANFCREAWQPWNSDLSCWSPTHGGFENLEQFGELVIE